MRKFGSLLAAAVLLPLPAFAADATTPVREIMQLVEANWSETSSDFQDYFSQDRLASLYSSDFVKRYKLAAEAPFAKEAGTPFDYDVIVNSQDGCPLKNISIAPKPAKDGTTEVVVRFQSMTCFGPDKEYQEYSEARFIVLKNGDHYVIDDIQTVLDGELDSLKQEMDEIAKSD